MEDPDEITTVLESNDDETEFALVFKRPNKKILMADLILELECYLTELTRAEADLRKPGVELH